MSKVLFITPHLTNRPAAGGTQVTWDRLQALLRHHHVTVLCMKAEGTFEFPVHVAGALRPRNATGLARAYGQGLPLSIWRNCDPALLEAAAALGRAGGWDVVYADHWLMWPAAKQVQARRKILHLHNAEHLLFKRAAARMGGAVKYIAIVEAGRARRYLAQVCQEADEVHYLSNQDRVLSENDSIKGRVTRVFPPCSEPAISDAIRNSPGEGRVVTVGSLTWEPTRAGMSWFLSEVWPHLAWQVSLTVAGRGADPALLKQLQDAPALHYLGFVENVDALYAGAKVFIAPLLDGSGIKIKIINSLARGIPVVTTTAGVEGFPPGFDDFVKIADSAQEFSKSTKQLATLDMAAWQLLSLKSRAYARMYFSGAQFDEWCAGL